MPNKSRQEQKAWQGGFRSSSSFLTIGVQLAGSMLVYIFIGYFLDRWLDTAPWLLLVGSVVGMFAFYVQLYRLVQRLNTVNSRKKDDPGTPN